MGCVPNRLGIYEVASHLNTNSKMESLVFQVKGFQELTNDELYGIMVIRQEVFSVEQNCPYLDADGLDQGAFHVLGTVKGMGLVAYSRLCPKGVSYSDYVSITRVVNKIGVRGKGVGRKLMDFNMSYMNRHFKEMPIKISAQTYLTAFYQSYGFQTVGESYLEDGIPHIAMIHLNGQ